MESVEIKEKKKDYTSYPNLRKEGRTGFNLFKLEEAKCGCRLFNSGKHLLKYDHYTIVK